MLPDYQAHIPALIVLFPLLTAVIVALVPWQSLAWALAMLATGLSFLLALEGLAITDEGVRVSYHLGGWSPPWGIEFVADTASMLIAVVVSSLCFASTLYAKRLMEKEIEPYLLPKAYSVWLLTIGGIQGLVLTGDVFNLFVFLEISALASVTLIAMGSKKDRRALTAAFNYLIVSAVGSTFYVIGVGFCYALTGTLNMEDLAQRLPQVTATAPLLAGFCFMVAGIFVKAGVFPVHIWLPAAYGYAPSAVSTMLAAVATKASLYVLARIVFTIFGGVEDIGSLILEWVLLPVSVMAMFVGTILAIMETDLKKLLAQSSVAQIGYITLGFSLGNIAGVSAGFIHIANHAMIKGGLFMAAGAFAFVALGRGLGRGIERVSVNSLAGMGRAMPLTATAMTICGLSLVGLPLTAGFISKVYLVLAVISTSWWLTAAVVISSALSLVYFWRIVEAVWFKPLPTRAKQYTDYPMIYLPLWGLAIANIWFGINGGDLVVLAESAAISIGVGGES